MSAVVTTVTGDVHPEAAGFTLPHEHLLTQFWHARHRFDLASMPEDTQYIVDELRDFSASGGTTVVDVTPNGLNRNPEELRELSARTGVQVVMGCGWYRDHYYPAEALLESRSVHDLSQELIQEIVDGVGSTGVRPGIIGEIGTEKAWVSPTEERVHRAAGRASAATGLAVMTHSFASTVGLWQLQILTEEGCDPSRVIIGHADTYRDAAYHRELLRRGATIEFDTHLWYRPQIMDQAYSMLAEYVAEGWRDQLLVSLDTCKAEHLRVFGGSGFVGVYARVIPGLLAAGLTHEDVTALFVTNPARMLSVSRTEQVHES